MTDWRFTQDEFINLSQFNAPGQEIELIVEREHIEVQVIRGHGFMREETTAYVPVEVMVKMLEHAGWKITPPGTRAEEEKT